MKTATLLFATFAIAVARTLYSRAEDGVDVQKQVTLQGQSNTTQVRLSHRRGAGLGLAWARLLAPAGAAATGATIGGALDGKSGAVKDATLGSSIALGFDFERHREMKVDAMTDAFMRNVQEPRNLELIRQFAQHVQEHPGQFEGYVADPEWQAAIDSARQIASIAALPDSLAERGQELKEFQRSFYQAVSLRKHALLTGAGTGFLGVTPHIVEKILSLVEDPASGKQQHSREKEAITETGTVTAAVDEGRPPTESASLPRFTARIARVSHPIDIPNDERVSML